MADREDLLMDKGGIQIEGSTEFEALNLGDLGNLVLTIKNNNDKNFCLKEIRYLFHHEIYKLFFLTINITNTKIFV